MENSELERDKHERTCLECIMIFFYTYVQVSELVAVVALLEKLRRIGAQDRRQRQVLLFLYFVRQTSSSD